MSFIDDFIYRVKTGRLFAGLEKTVKPEETDNPVAVSKLDSNPKVSKGINRQITVLETKVKMMEEMNKELMVLETKIEALKETSKETMTEPLPRTPEEKATVIQPPVKKQIGPDVVIHFVCMNKTYIVENFNLNFRQDVDTLKNRPDSFTYGGIMQITLNGFLDSDLEDWITQTYLTRNGEIRFFPNMPKITDSSLLTVFFEDAYCTACKKTIDAVTFGVLTTLTVSPRRIRLGNEEFENARKEKESLQFTIKSV